MEMQLTSKSTLNIQKTSVLQQTAYWAKVKKKQGFKAQAFDIKIPKEDSWYLEAGRQAGISAQKPHTVTGHDKGHMQSANAEKKDSHGTRDIHQPGYPAGGYQDHPYVKDDLLVLFQQVGKGFTIAYLPYGPALRPEEDRKGIFLENLSECLRPHLKDTCIALRYDLDWESFWAKDASFYHPDGSWKGPPPVENQEIRLNFNTGNWNLRKARTNMLPADTLFLDLTKPEEQLLREMKPKTRYNIRLAFRKGVRIRKGRMDDLNVWYALYTETCHRNHIFLHDVRYFKTVLGTDAWESKSPADMELLIAEKDNQPLAAMFLSISGSRASYLYGASASANRNLMATYALQWEAIRRSKARGCEEYDMFGIPPSSNPAHPLYGLDRFKRGFGGSPYHRLGCWDYPLNEEVYGLYLAAEMNGQGYHLS